MKTNTVGWMVGACTAVAAIALLVILAYPREETFPGHSFRLTVNRLYHTPDERITLLAIETHEPLWQQIWSDGQTWGGLTSSHPNNASNHFRARNPDLFLGQIWVIVSRAPYGNGKDRIKTIIGSGMIVREAPPGSPLEQTFDLRIKDGVYPLSQPLVIGRMDGVDLKLAVGPLGKIEVLRVEDRALRGDPER